MTQTLPEPNHVIADKYVVERCLGIGGMGAVYAVSHRVTGKRLALKCLLPQYQAYPELVERFLREAQAAGRIQHRHVVDVFDVGRDDATLYLVMPLLEGKPLSALLRERTQPLEDTLAILLRAMDGVAAAHAQGIVHRDLKPDNIFVCVGPSGKLDDPKVLDFGISKLDDENDQHALTKSGILMGTPHYMSFEQLKGQRDVDARADVYALGVILYEAIAGELPYVAESAPALAIRMMSEPPVHLAQHRPDLPEGLTQPVMKAIALERDERFENAAALAKAIAPWVSADVLQGGPAPARVGLRVEGGEAAPPARVRRTPPEASKTAAEPLARLRLDDEPERARTVRTSSSKLLGLSALAAALILCAGVALWWFGASGGQNTSGAQPRSAASKPAAAVKAPSAGPKAPETEAQAQARKARQRLVKRMRKAQRPAQAGGSAPNEELEEVYEEVEEEDSSEGTPSEPSVATESPLPSPPTAAEAAAPPPSAPADRPLPLPDKVIPDNPAVPVEGPAPPALDPPAQSP